MRAGRWRQIQRAQNLIQLASHIALTEWRTGTGYKHASTLAVSEVTGQHLNQSWFDVDRSAARLGFWSNFPPFQMPRLIVNLPFARSTSSTCRPKASPQRIPVPARVANKTSLATRATPGSTLRQVTRRRVPGHCKFGPGMLSEDMDLRLDTPSQSDSPKRWKNEKGRKSRAQIARIPSDS
jgi:hypothetical protein